MDWEKSSEVLLNQILSGSVPVFKTRRWLENLKLSSCSCGLTREYLSQARFVLFVLNKIHSEARDLQTSIKSICPKSSDPESTKFCAPVVQPDKQPSLQWDKDYSSNFPSLNDCPPSKKEVQKSKRRINPTPISSEEVNKVMEFPPKNCDENLSRHGIEYSISTGKEALFSKRFVSSEKKKKRRSNDSGLNLAEDNIKTIYLSDDKVIKLEKLSELYNIFFDYYLVNVTVELRFILNVFSILSEIDEKHIKNKNQENQLCKGILSSVFDWMFLCFEVFVRHVNLLSKLEFSTRNYICSKISLFIENHKTFPKNERLDSFISTMMHNPEIQYNLSYASERNFCINEKNEFDFQNQEEESRYSQGRLLFIQQKNTASTKSDINLDLNFLKFFGSSINLSYFFGQLFVECLIFTIEESLWCKNDESQKRNQLNVRLITPLSSDPDHENFLINELFYKKIIDYCVIIHSDYITYIRHWLYKKILELSDQPQEEIVLSIAWEIPVVPILCSAVPLTAQILFEQYSTPRQDDLIPVDMRNSLLFDLRIKISLAKFLGYIDFYHRRTNKEILEREKNILLQMYSEVPPPTDIKSLLLKAVKTGCVTITVPWVIQYLSMADFITVSSPYFHDIIFLLISFYLSNQPEMSDDPTHKLRDAARTKNDILKMSVIIPSRENQAFEDTIYTEGMYLNVKESSVIFIKIWISKFFENKNFGDTLFFKFLDTYINKLSFIKYKGSCKRCIDCIDLIDHFAYNLVCPHFNKLKYWENSSAVVIKNIRPLQLPSESEDKHQDIQLQMEEKFLSDHQNINTLINFIVSRLSNIFETELSTIIEQDELYKKAVNLKKNITDASKSKLIELLLNCHERALKTMESLSPPSQPKSVLDASIGICTKKVNSIMKELISNKGIDKDTVCYLMIDNSKTESSDLVQSNNCHATGVSIPDGIAGSCSVDNYQLDLEDSLSALFSQMNIYACEIAYNSKEMKESNISGVMDNLKKIGNRINTDDAKLWNDFCIISWNYFLQMILEVPDFISLDIIDDFFFILKKKIVKNTVTILCPRVITPAAEKNRESQKKIANKIGQLITHALGSLLNPEEVEHQFINILQFTWSMKQLEFINVLLSTILDQLTECTLDYDLIDLTNTIEAVAEAINDMKKLC